jgi:hypothetical protein
MKSKISATIVATCPAGYAAPSRKILRRRIDNCGGCRGLHISHDYNLLHYSPLGQQSHATATLFPFSKMRG